MCFNLSLDKWGKMYARLGRVYFASSTTLMQLQYVEKGYENKLKFSWGCVILFMVYLDYKNNCSFFFTLIEHDKLVNEDNEEISYLYPFYF